MVAAGFRNHWLNGVDYVGKNGSKIEDLSHYTLPIIVAIVVSGQYKDDLDNCEDVVYTGQGGNNLLGNRQQISDQKLERGNLGLKSIRAPTEATAAVGIPSQSKSEATSEATAFTLVVKGNSLCCCTMLGNSKPDGLPKLLDNRV